MDGFILAAGLGRRLAPLTNDMPKCLVEVGGIPMLERTARRLVEAGCDRLVVNVCPFADEIEDFIERRDGFGVEVRVSREEGRPLETGGGLLAARRLLRRDAPFFVLNADVYTDFDLDALGRAHAASDALVTLAVMHRPSTRGLLFDARGLVGRVNDDADGEVLARRAEGALQRLAFACGHVVSPAFLDQVVERGRFGIFEPYLRLAGEGARILPHAVDGCTWVDVGRPEDLARADRLASA